MLAEPVLLDTDTLSELSRGNPAVTARARAYLSEFGRLTISTVTVFERLRGYRQAILAGKPFQRQMHAFEALSAQSVVLPFDNDAADVAATIWAAISRTQRQHLGDILIAAVAFWGLSGFFRVQPDELGVVMRFGKYTRDAKPGLNYHLPYPIETVLLPKVTRVNRIDIGMRLVEDLRRRVRLEVEVGEKGKLELTRAEAELARAQAAVRSADVELAKARALLKAVIGSSSDDTLDAVGNLDETVQFAPLHDLRQQVLDSHPALAESSALTARSKAIVSQEKARRIPEPTVSGEYERQPDTTVRHAFLWNAVTWRRGPASREFHLGPLLAVRQETDAGRVAFGAGLFGFRRTSAGGRWQPFLFDFRMKAANKAGSASSP